MAKNLEIIFDSTPSGGCGCNCGCEGSNIVEDMNNLVSELQEFDFKTDLSIGAIKISDMDTISIINKINGLLEKTNSDFRVNEDNLEEALSNLLPMVVLDNRILTAFGVPSLNDVIMEVHKAL